jgi:hypothetical protein
MSTSDIQQRGSSRKLGSRYNEAQVLCHLAESRRADGDTGAAREAWRTALRILDDLGHPEAEHVRKQLASS